MKKLASELTLAQVWDYARCPYRHFWRHRARIAPPPTARGLVEEHVRVALSLTFGHAANPPTEGPKQADLMTCLGAAWRATIERWGLAHGTWTSLVEFASVRARVWNTLLDRQLIDSESARLRGICLDAGPDISGEYERCAATAGLPDLTRQLRGRLSGAPVRVSEEYGVAEAFADSVDIVERNAWPDLDEVKGAALPYTVHLLGEQTLTATADLVTQDPDGAVTIEVHDYDETDWFPAAWLRRDLRVVAALHSHSEVWAGVRDVIFRNLQLGKTARIPSGPGEGRLLTAVIGAAAGIRHRVYVPRLAVRSRDCRSCPFIELCSNGQDILDKLDATLLGAVRS